MLRAKPKPKPIETAATAREAQTKIADRFKAVLDAFVTKGGDDAAYRQYISAVTGLTVTAKDPNAALKTVQTWATSKEGGIRWGLNILKFLLVLFVARIVAGIACKVAKKAVGKAALSDLLKAFITNTTRRVVMILGFILALSMLEVNVGPLLAGVGVVGFVLGFAPARYPVELCSRFHDSPLPTLRHRGRDFCGWRDRKSRFDEPGFHHRTDA